jgi:hypothetical protein
MGCANSKPPGNATAIVPSTPTTTPSAALSPANVTHEFLLLVPAKAHTTEYEPLEGAVLRLMQLNCFLCRLNKYENCVQNKRLASYS